MKYVTWMAIGVLLLASTAGAKKKEKVVLPDFVLKATTVLVVIQPDTGEPMMDPTANRKAVEEVEKALMRWGRLRVVMDASTADLVIAVKKGTGRMAEPTIRGGPIDSRPGTMETTDGQIRIGGQQGRPTGVTQTGGAAEDSRVHPGMEAGSEQDIFQVYRGGIEHPLDGSPVWRYVARDALRGPDVAAVAEFHKAVDEAEKQAARRQQQPKKNP